MVSCVCSLACLVDWLISWLVACLLGWLVGCLLACLLGWLVGWLGSWLVGCLVGCLLLTCSLARSLACFSLACLNCLACSVTCEARSLAYSWFWATFKLLLRNDISFYFLLVFFWAWFLKITQNDISFYFFFEFFEHNFLKFRAKKPPRFWELWARFLKNTRTWCDFEIGLSTLQLHQIFNPIRLLTCKLRYTAQVYIYS